MKYGKLINGNLIAYRQPIRTQNGDIFTNDGEIIIQYGFKEIIETPKPETESGYYAVPHWEETETQILQVWDIFPLPEPSPEEQLEDAKEALNILGVN